MKAHSRLDKLPDPTEPESQLFFCVVVLGLEYDEACMNLKLCSTSILKSLPDHYFSTASIFCP